MVFTFFSHAEAQKHKENLIVYLFVMDYDNKAAQIIQQKARTYQKNGVMVESKHHAKHADLRGKLDEAFH